jgi:putative phosphoribosyl transferase
MTGAPVQTWEMFADRADAGHLLADKVTRVLADPASPTGVADAIVLGLPRGGVPVAALVAQALGVHLDVLVVRKIGLPYRPELALGAVGELGAVVLNDDVVGACGLAPDELDGLIRQAAAETKDLVSQLRPQSGPPDVRGRMSIVVDDGVATGATARVAASVLHSSGSGPVILATPVAALSTSRSLQSCFDEVVTLSAPVRFGSVGQFYERFEQVGIARVRELLAASPP